MLTHRDVATQTETGLIPPDRLRALKHALLAEATDALAAARQPGIDPRFEASLRGKRKALSEAAQMVQHIIDGSALHPRAHSSSRRRRG